MLKHNFNYTHGDLFHFLCGSYINIFIYLLFQLGNSYLWLLKLGHNIAPRNLVLNHFR